MLTSFHVQQFVLYLGHLVYRLFVNIDKNMSLLTTMP